MAKIVGQAGKYVSHQATNLRNSMWITAAFGIGTLGYIAGFAMAGALPRVAFPGWGGWSIQAACGVAMLAFAKWCFRRLDNLERDREHWRRGAAGEATVGLALDELPDAFRVIHDVATPYGNIDHVVVGPTGVFMLETKDWRGIVTGDGQGELTLNGRPLDQPYIRRFVARVLDLKEKVHVLAPGPDVYFEAVFVFTSARVEANFGTTGEAHCIRDQQLFDYIVNKRFGRKLPATEVAQIAQAFLGLARLESGFSEKAEPARRMTVRREPRPFTRRPTQARRPVLANA